MPPELYESSQGILLDELGHDGEDDPDRDVLPSDPAYQAALVKNEIGEALAVPGYPKSIHYRDCMPFTALLTARRRSVTGLPMSMPFASKISTPVLSSRRTSRHGGLARRSLPPSGSACRPARRTHLPAIARKTSARRSGNRSLAAETFAHCR
jgi:hypothetical protein